MAVISLATDISHEGASVGQATATVAQAVAALQFEGATGQPCPVAAYTADDEPGYYSPIQSASPAGSADLETARSRTPRAGQGRPLARAGAEGDGLAADAGDAWEGADFRRRPPRPASHRGSRAID